MLEYVLCLERKGEQENHNAVFIASFPYGHSLIPRSSDIQTPFWMPSGSLLEVKIEVESGDSFFNSY